MATVPTPEEATSWLKIVGIVVGGFFTFISGVVTATIVVVNKVNGFEKDINSLESSKETDRKLCALYREAVSKEIAGLTDFHKTSLVQLQASVSAGNAAIIRLHERIDECLVNHDGEVHSRRVKRTVCEIIATHGNMHDASGVQDLAQLHDDDNEKAREEGASELLASG